MMFETESRNGNYVDCDYGIVIVVFLERFAIVLMPKMALNNNNNNNNNVNY